MVLVVYGLIGTLVQQDCFSQKDVEARKGAMEALRAQRRLGWNAAIFADDEQKQVEEALLKTGLAGAFTEMHCRQEIDREGIKNLGVFAGRDSWVVIVSDAPKDTRAARMEGASVVRVPRFSSKDDKFDFSAVQALLEAIVLEGFAEFRKKMKLAKTYETPEFLEFGGERIRVRVFPHRFEAQFY